MDRDIWEKNCLSANERYADLINGLLLEGEQILKPEDLHGILDFTDIPEKLRKYVNNYPIHVFEIAKLERTEVFQTDLKQIFDFIRYAKDKKRLKKLVENDPAYQNMDEDAYDM